MNVNRWKLTYDQAQKLRDNSLPRSEPPLCHFEYTSVEVVLVPNRPEKVYARFTGAPVNVKVATFLTHVTLAEVTLLPTQVCESVLACLTATARAPHIELFLWNGDGHVMGPRVGTPFEALGRMPNIDVLFREVLREELMSEVVFARWLQDTAAMQQHRAYYAPIDAILLGGSSGASMRCYCGNNFHSVTSLW